MALPRPSTAHPRAVATQASALRMQRYRRWIRNVQPRQSEALCCMLAHRIDGELAHCSPMPPAYMAFFVEVLSDPSLFGRTGAWNFPQVLGRRRHALTLTDFKRLGNCVVDNYVRYLDEDLCLALCDLIARCFHLEHAAALLARLKLLEAGKPPSLQGIADDGLRIFWSRRSGGIPAASRS